MATMMPAVCPSDCPSPAEPEIFESLRTAPGTSDWIALHSLDIAEHVERISGEADFVVVVPGFGVLCLEVKGARQITRSADGWYIGRNAKLDPRGPFKQASQALHSLRKILVGRRPDLGRILFASAVVMPYVPFAESSSEWHDWQVIDAQKYNSSPIQVIVESVLARARQHAESHASRWFDSDKSGPTREQAKAIAQALRPQFEVLESPRARAKRVETEIKRFTEEQFGALDAMATNPRVVFEGPAGTGKTLLAIEAARRSSLRGEKVLLLCFNRLLSRWLIEECRPLSEHVVADSLHAHMLHVAGLRADAEEGGSFWDSELPQSAAEALLDDQLLQQFDFLIVDEAQDLLRPQYLDFFELSLKGGLRSGRWMMFGDFTGQDIYGVARMLETSERETRLGYPALYSLRKNCRNTPRVSALVSPIGGLEPDYSGVLRSDDGVEPAWLYYRDEQHEKEVLESALAGLLRDGYRRQEIVVLSPRADDHSLAGKLSSSRADFAAYQPGVKGKIRYCSIHAFKGLESPAVVVTDVTDIGGFNQQALLYVAITRATSRLVLCVSATEREHVAQAVLAALAKGGG